MKAFDVDILRHEQSQSRDAYYEFLREPALSAGVYMLPAGAHDSQQPHCEDEIYYIIAGRATLRVAREDRPVRPGTIVYVPAGVPHRFHRIVEDLTTLVFFAPAESAGGDQERVTHGTG